MQAMNVSYLPDAYNNNSSYYIIKVLLSFSPLILEEVAYRALDQEESPFYSGCIGAS